MCKSISKNVLIFKTLFSIPQETTLDGQQRFSQCYMYNFNYTNISTIIYQEELIIPCQSGWIYEIDDNSNSVVSEVRYHKILL